MYLRPLLAVVLLEQLDRDVVLSGVLVKLVNRRERHCGHRYQCRGVDRWRGGERWRDDDRWRDTVASIAAPVVHRLALGGDDGAVRNSVRRRVDDGWCGLRRGGVDGETGVWTASRCGSAFIAGR